MTESNSANHPGPDFRIDAVILTYRRPEYLRKSIEELLPLKAHGIRSLVVVDNDVARSAWPLVAHLLDENSPNQVEYLPLDENLGPAGGWACGMRHVLGTRQDVDWVLLLDDDDPLPSPETLPFLLSQLPDSNLKRVGAIGLAGYFHKLPWFLSDDKSRVTGSVREVNSIGSGVFPLYSARALRDVGVFRDDLFFGFEDSELGLRMSRAGYTLLTPHRLPESIRRNVRALTGEKQGDGSDSRRLPEVSWRRYFSLRNSIVIIREYGGLFPAAIHAILRGFIKPMAYLPVQPRVAWSHLTINFAAVKDAFLGRMGSQSRGPGEPYAPQCGPPLR